MAQRTCAYCGADISHTHANRRYCSVACKWQRRKALDGIPCSVCGEPTGWVAQSGKAAVIHKRCSRGPTYRVKNKRARGYIDHWTCAGCGVECERPATKGQKPKWCEKCRRVQRNRLIKVSHSVRLSIYARDDWTCWLCGDPVEGDLIGSHSEWRPSLDHVVLRSRGGSDDPANLRLAHWWCNIVRCDERAYTPEDFRVAV